MYLVSRQDHRIIPSTLYHAFPVRSPFRIDGIDDNLKFSFRIWKYWEILKNELLRGSNSCSGYSK